MDIQDSIDELADDLAISYLGLDNPELPDDQFGELCFDLSKNFRALGVLLLLGEGSTDLFLHNLIRSGRSRRTFLVRRSEKGMADEYFVASGFYDPLLDAIVSGDLALARELGSLGSQECGLHELPDDHYYARLLHCLVSDPVPQDLVSEYLQAFEEYQEGASSFRLKLIQALVVGDQADFDDAFEELIEDFEEDVELEDAVLLEESPLRATHQVCIEALALLKLADLHGLTTEPEYSYCPSLARVPMKIPYKEIEI